MLDGLDIRIIPLQSPQRLAHRLGSYGVDEVRPPLLACPQDLRQEFWAAWRYGGWVSRSQLPTLLVDGAEQLLPLSVHQDARRLSRALHRPDNVQEIRVVPLFRRRHTPGEALVGVS